MTNRKWNKLQRAKFENTMARKRAAKAMVRDGKTIAEQIATPRIFKVNTTREDLSELRSKVLKQVHISNTLISVIEGIQELLDYTEEQDEE